MLLVQILLLTVDGHHPNNPMNVIIYAAGISRRLRNFAPNGLKGLINLGDKKIIEYQLRWISKLKLENIVIVIGLEHQDYIDYIGYEYNNIPVKYIFNKDYETKGNMLSLWCAREYCSSDTIFTTSDLLCNIKDVNKFLNSSAEDKILIDNNTRDLFLDDDPVKISIHSNKIIALRKQIKELSSIDGISVGIYKFGKIFMNLLLNDIDTKIKAGDDNKSLYYAIDNVLKIRNADPVYMDNNLWVDIDTPSELKKAQKNVHLYENK